MTEHQIACLVKMNPAPWLKRKLIFIEQHLFHFLNSVRNEFDRSRATFRNLFLTLYQVNSFVVSDVNFILLGNG